MVHTTYHFGLVSSSFTPGHIKERAKSDMCLFQRVPKHTAA